MTDRLALVRLSAVAPADILAHMVDPRVGAHLPLATFAWDAAAVANLVAAKEACWARDGLGHWGFLWDGAYVGWGGLQREGEEWDLGLVLRADAFGLGPRIARRIIDFAHGDGRVPFVTFLLPPSRRHLGALGRLGAVFIGEVFHEGARFRKYRLDTATTASHTERS